jgi:hypothetical protein
MDVAVQIIITNANKHASFHCLAAVVLTMNVDSKIVAIVAPGASQEIFVSALGKITCKNGMYIQVRNACCAV